jgi:hypothetical protein
MFFAQFILLLVFAIVGLWLLIGGWELLALMSFGFGGLYLAADHYSRPHDR